MLDHSLNRLSERADHCYAGGRYQLDPGADAIDTNQPVFEDITLPINYYRENLAIRTLYMDTTGI